MKTRQELILDFMLALSANYEFFEKCAVDMNMRNQTGQTGDGQSFAEAWIFNTAAQLTDEYLENV
jgi:hypothetical protein